MSDSVKGTHPYEWRDIRKVTHPGCSSISWMEVQVPEVADAYRGPARADRTSLLAEPAPYQYVETKSGLQLALVSPAGEGHVKANFLHWMGLTSACHHSANKQQF
mgnify:CR=1 FL=1